MNFLNPFPQIRKPFALVVSLLSLLFIPPASSKVIGLSGETLLTLGSLNGCVFAPDGKHILTYSRAGAFLWDIDKATVVKAFFGHTGYVTSVAFSPDGAQVLTGSGDHTAKLWDVETGEVLRTFAGHTSIVTSVAFSPDSAQVLTGSGDHTAKLWDVETGEVLRTFAGHTGSVDPVAFSPDGAQVLTWSRSRGGGAKVWDSQTGALLRDIFVGPNGSVGNEVFSVVFSPDGTQVSIGMYQDGKHTAELWDIQTGAFLRTFPGHTEAVCSAAFSPDGTQALTGSGDRTAKLWDIQTGALLRTFAGHTGSVTSVAFSSDGTQVLTGSSDDTAKLWDVDTEALPHTFAGHSSGGTTATFSPDGAQVLSAAKLWEVETGEVFRTFPGHTGRVTSVAFSPDGTLALTGSEDRTAMLWNIQTGALLRTFAGHTGYVTSVAFSPDGAKVLTGSSDDTAKLWDVQTGTLLHTFAGHPGDVYSVAFSPDGAQVLTGSWGRTAKLWDAVTGALLRTFVEHTEAVCSVAFSPDGTWALTGSWDGTAKLWDAVTGALLRTFAGHRSFISSVAFSPDGTTVLTGSEDHTAKLWDVETGEVLRTFAGHSDDVTSVAFSPDGTTVLTGSEDDTAKLWDVETGEVLRTFAGDNGSVYSVSFSPDGKKILTCYYSIAKLWDAQTGEVLRTFGGHSSGEDNATFSPDGKKILTCYSSIAKLWDAQTGEVLRTFAGHTSYVTSVAFSPDGTQVLTGSSNDVWAYSFDGTAKLWDVETGEVLRTFAGHSDYGITSVAFSPDGAQVLTGCFDGTAKLWDVKTGQVLRTFKPSRTVTSVAFSPDGARVLTGGDYFYDGTAKLWEVETEEVLRTFAGHTGSVTSVAFSPDSTQVLTSSIDGTIRIWDSGIEANPDDLTEIIELTENTSSQFTIKKTKKIFCKINPICMDSLLEFESESFQGNLYIVARQGSIPNKLIFDKELLLTDSQLSGNVVLQNCGNAPWYIAVYGDFQEPDEVSFTISNRCVEFDVLSINPNIHSNTGTMACVVEGVGFSKETIYSLNRWSGENISPVEIGYLTPTRAELRFELDNQPAGTYSLVAQSPLGTDVLENAVTLHETKEGYKLKAQLSTEAVLRSGLKYTVWLDYGNEGDTDMPAPLFKISSSKGTKLSFSSEGPFEVSSLWALGIGTQFPAGVLRAGDKNRIPIYYIANQECELQLSVIENITDRSWVGSAWTGFDDYVRSLRYMADKFSRRDVQEYRVPVLERQYEMEQSAGGSLAGISGKIRSATDEGKPIKYASLTLYGIHDQSIRQVTTDYFGNFSFENIKPGSYEFFMKDYYIPDQQPLVLNQDEYLTRLELLFFPIPKEEPVEETPPLAPDSSPSLARDTQGNAHLVWQHEEETFLATMANGEWFLSGPIPSATGTSIKILPNTRLPQESEDLIVTWRDDTGNESDLYYALGRISSQTGKYEWSSPINLTQDKYYDGDYTLAPTSDGYLFIWLKKDWSIEDDTDLYYEKETMDVSGIEWQNLESIKKSVSRTGTVNPQELVGEIGGKFSLMKEIPDILSDLFPFLGGRYGLEIGLDYSSDLVPDCDSYDQLLEGDLVLAFGRWFEDKIALSADGKYVLKNSDGLCEYRFNQWGVSLSYGRTKYFKPFKWSPKLPKPVNLECSIGGNFGFELKGNISRLPEQFIGFVQMSDVLGLKGEADLKIEKMSITNAEAVLDGTIRLVAKYPWNLTPEYKITFKAEGKLFGFVKGGVTVVLSTDDFDFDYFVGPDVTVPFKTIIRNSELLKTAGYKTPNGGFVSQESKYRIEVSEGTGNRYGFNPVLPSIENDVKDDGAPDSVGDGDSVWVIWAKDSNNPQENLGNTVNLSQYKNGQWLEPIIVSDPQTFNSNPSISLIRQAETMIAWSQAKVTTTLDSPVEEILNNIGQGDIVVSTRINGMWNSPQEIAHLEGHDDQVRIAADGQGMAVASWLNHSASGEITVYASKWDGVTWSAPAKMTDSTECISVDCEFNGNTPVVVWSQKDYEGKDQQQVERIYTSTWSNSWSSPKQLNLSDVSGKHEFTSSSGGHAFSVQDSVIVTPTPTPTPNLSGFGHSEPYRTSDADVQSKVAVQGMFTVPTPRPECCPSIAPTFTPTPSPEPTEQPIGEPIHPPVVAPIDPNEKTVSKEGAVDRTEPLHYTIYFENQSSASAAASVVKITDNLDQDLDWNTFELTAYSFGDKVISVPKGKQNHFVREPIALWDWRDNAWIKTTESAVVDIEATLDLAKGKVLWKFSCLNPMTDEPPSSPYAGFLPPEVAKDKEAYGRGQGYVSYTIYPKSGAAANENVENFASIVFDENAPILTNVVSNTIREAQPSAPVLLYPSNQSDNVLPRPVLMWAASQGASEYDLYLWDASADAPGSPTAVGVKMNYFSSTLLKLGQNYHWQVVARNSGGSNASRIGTFSTVFEKVPDFDHNGQVDSKDLLRLIEASRTKDLQFDLNYDEKINTSDYTVFSRYWTKSLK